MTQPRTIRADAVRAGDYAVHFREVVAEAQEGYRTSDNLPAVVLVLEHTGRVIFPAAELVRVAPGVTLSAPDWETVSTAARLGTPAGQAAERVRAVLATVAEQVAR
jgi:hypothetical protein